MVNSKHGNRWGAGGNAPTPLQYLDILPLYTYFLKENLCFLPAPPMSIFRLPPWYKCNEPATPQETSEMSTH